MIYIKTDMKEMPKGCTDCDFFVQRECLAEQALGRRGILPLYTVICPLAEFDEDTQLTKIITEMAETYTTKKRFKLHTEKQIAEFEIKLVSVEFKEEIQNV